VRECACEEWRWGGGERTMRGSREGGREEEDRENSDGKFQREYI
jgi:hypothetical protein